MKLWALFSKINELFDNPQARRKRRLYKQWVEMEDLSPEVVVQEKAAERATEVEEVSERKQSQLQLPSPLPLPLPLPMLYIMQGASLVLLCVILIILIAHAC